MASVGSETRVASRRFGLKYAGVAIILAFVISSISCKDSLDVVGGYRPQLVAYSILSTETDTQYVRVLSNYIPPSGADSGTPVEITGAQVSISDGNTLTVFHDTTVTRPSGGDPVHAYVAYGFMPTGGATYTLSVAASGYDPLSASTHVPAHAVLDADIADNAVIRNAYFEIAVAQPTVSFQPSPGASAYFARLEVVLDDYRPEGTVRKVILVPQWIELIACFAALYRVHYPDLVPLNSTNGGMNTFRYRNWAWRHVVDSVLDQGAYDPHFRRGRFTIVQLNGDWYRYYRTARSFEDRFSIRLDEPDYTNIRNGWGVFGAYVVDTVSVPMNERQVPPDPRSGYTACTPSGFKE